MENNRDSSDKLQVLTNNEVKIDNIEQFIVPKANRLFRTIQINAKQIDPDLGPDPENI